MISDVGRQHQAAHIPGREHGGGASSPGQRLRPPTLGSGSSDGPGQGGPGWPEAGTHIRTFSGQEEDLPQAPERHLKEPGILLGILDLTAMLP